MKKYSQIYVHKKTDVQQHAMQKQAKRLYVVEKLKEYFADDANLKSRFESLTNFARNIRSTEYHVTNACNIRCKGCWFYEYAHDKETHEEKNLHALEVFLEEEIIKRKINNALVIGGEPALFLDRLSIYRKKMKYLTISSNGLKKIPQEGFENVTIGLRLFGGGVLDDQLRAIKPSGHRFTGLFEKALENYNHDLRAIFIYAVTEDGIQYIEDTIKKIRDNGNIASFNFYSKYGTENPSALAHRNELKEEVLRVKALYPETVISHPYYIKTMIDGQSHWDSFRYENCPSISCDHPAHASRLNNGFPTLPFFNTWSADLKTLKYCCTSGHCDGCRDSQAVFSWLMINMAEFLDSAENFQVWIEIAESYWSQFYWSPFSRNQ